MKFAFAAILSIFAFNCYSNECLPFNFPKKFELINYKFIESEGNIITFPAKKGILSFESNKLLSLARYFENDSVKTHKSEVSNFCKMEKLISWTEIIDTMDYVLERECNIIGRDLECTTLFTDPSDNARFGAVEHFTLQAIE